MVVQATRQKECTDCRKETVVTDERRKDGILTIYTICEDCKVEYTTTFRLKT